MREPRASFGRRALVSVTASLSLHAVVGVGAASMVLGGTIGALWPDANPLIVEILSVEDGGAPAVSTRPRVPRGPAPRAVTSPSGSTPGPLAMIASPGAERTALPTAAIPAAESPEGESTERGVEVPVASTLVEGGPEAEPLAHGEAVHDGDDLVAADRPTAGGDIPRPGASTVNTPTPLALPTAAVSQARLDEVTRNPSLSAHAESEAMVGRREVFEFLLDHPDFATHITRALRLARYRIWRTDDGMFVDDGWGATGQITVVQAAGGTRVLYAKGEFHHKLLPIIPGEAVVTIDYDVRPMEDGRELLQARIWGQLKIDSAFATLMLKIASTVAREKAAKESRRLLQTFAKVLRAIDETPAEVYASVSGRPDVPRLELEQFRVLLGLP